MTARAILREAWLNVLSGTSRALTISIALIFVTLSIQMTDLFVTRQLVEEAEAFQATGASIQTVTATGRIDGALCDALSELPTVRAAGAVRTAASELYLASLPRSPIPLYEVTSGFAAVLNAETSLAGRGLLLSTKAAETVGDTESGVVLAGGGSAPVRGKYSYPDDGRRTGFAYAALAESANGAPFDECWVDAWPQNQTIQALLLTSVLQSTNERDEEPAELAPLNSTLGVTFTGGEQNADRITLWALPFAGLVAFAVCWATTALRRLELASAVHSRVRKADLLQIHLIETLGWILPVVSTALCAALFFAATGPPGDYVTTLVQGSKIPAVTIVAGLIGVVTGVTLARESHLFRYFKSR